MKRAAVGALMLTAYTNAAVDQQASEHTGTLRVLAISNRNKLPEYQYYLEDPATQERFRMHTHPLQFKGGEIKSGSPVTVKGSFVNGELHSEAVHFRDAASGSHKTGMHGLALPNPETGIRLAVVVPDFSLCPRGTGFTRAPRGNITQYQNVFFEHINPNGYTAGQQLRACSHGNYSVDATKSTIMRFTVPLANCSTGTSYSSAMNACPTSWGGVTNDFRNLAIQAGYTNWSSYTNHWMFIPQDWGCSFGGLGWVGANGLWIPDQYYTDISIILHEFGHNLDMNHASTYVNGVANEYGDATSMMGAIRDVCYTSSNRELAGWQQVPSINMTSIPKGYWTNFDIKSQDKHENAGLKIVTNLIRDGATRDGNVSIYLEFRRVSRWDDTKRKNTVAKGGDLGFDPKLAGVVMHFYPNPFPGAKALGGEWWSVLITTLNWTRGSNFSDWNRTGLHIRVRANNSFHNASDMALIEICRCDVGQNASTCCAYPAAEMLPVNKKQMATQTLGGLIGASCGAAAVGAAAAVIVVKKKRGTLTFPKINLPTKKPTTSQTI
jgi:hypothetical protein